MALLEAGGIIGTLLQIKNEVVLMGSARNKTSSLGLAAVSIVALLLLIPWRQVTLANAQAPVDSVTQASAAARPVGTSTKLCMSFAMVLAALVLPMVT
jgi:hypothetical protein